MRRELSELTEPGGGYMLESAHAFPQNSYMRLHRLGDTDGKTQAKLRAAALEVAEYIRALVPAGNSQPGVELPRRYCVDALGLYVAPLGRGYISATDSLQGLALFATDLATGLLPEIEAFAKSR